MTNELLHNAISSQSSGNYVEAERLYRIVLEDNPLDITALCNLSIILQPVDSMEIFAKIFRIYEIEGLKEKIPADLIEKINVQFQKNFYLSQEIIRDLFLINKKDILSNVIDKIIPVYEHAIDKATYKTYAQMKVQINKLDDAKKILLKLEGTFPDDPDVMLWTSNVYKLTNEPQIAIDYMMRHIKLSMPKTNIASILDLSFLMMKLGRLEEALEWVFCAENLTNVDI